MTSAVAKNPFIYNNANLDRLEQELAEAAKPFSADPAMAHYQAGVRNRVLGFVSVFGEALQERVKLVEANNPMFAAAQKVGEVVQKIRKEMTPLLDVYESSAKKIAATIAQLLQEQGLEDTDENREALLPKALESVKLQTKEWFVIRLDDLCQAALGLQEGDKEAALAPVLDAIKHLQATKSRMDKQIQQGVAIDPKAKQVYEAAMARLEEIDADGALRHQATSWAVSAKEARQLVKVGAPYALGIGAMFGLAFLQSKVMSGIESVFGQAAISATTLSLALGGFYHAVKNRSLIGIAFSTAYLYTQWLIADEYLRQQQQQYT
jgi:hypothetical protein